MTQSLAVSDDAIKFAESVLARDAQKMFEVDHSYNYLHKKKKRFKSFDEQTPHRVVYTGPGKARVVEIKLPNYDPRSGKYPQHNSVGVFPEKIEILSALVLEEFQDLSNLEMLETAGFVRETMTLTKKRIARIAKQFANLSVQCFQEMICLNQDSNKRDFNVWIKASGDNGLILAMVNPLLGTTQFFQTIKFDSYGEICDLRYITCEKGIPLVINQSCIDKYGNHRNLAHIGVAGSKKHTCRNSLERFDDGTVVWTTTDYSSGERRAGSAAMFYDGSIKILDESDRHLGELCARNLGAEAINLQTGNWSGFFGAEACVAEKDDKYILRTEYKMAVRNKVNQIVDGACIPGFEPIFKIKSPQVFHSR